MIILNKLSLCGSILLDSHYKSLTSHLKLLKRQNEFLLPSQIGENGIFFRLDIDKKTPNFIKLLDFCNVNNIIMNVYFRDKTLDLNLVEKLLNGGHEVGYHYETIANFLQENSQIDFLSPTYLTSETFRNLALEKFASELENFQQKTKLQIRSMCSHGSSINRKIGLSNAEILRPWELEQFTKIVDLYDPSLENLFVFYNSDTSIENNKGWRYQNADNIFNVQAGTKCILIHPHHWFFGKIKFKLRRVFRVLQKYNGNELYQSRKM